MLGKRKRTYGNISGFRVVREEKKYKDVPLYSDALNIPAAQFQSLEPQSLTAAHFTQTNCTGLLGNAFYNIPRGDEQGQREGRNILITGINMRFIAEVPFTSASTNPVQNFAHDMYRIVVVQDLKHTATTRLNASDPFVSATEGMTGTGSGRVGELLAWRDIEDTSRYKFLYDRTFTISASQSPGIDNHVTSNLSVFMPRFRRHTINLNFRNGLQVGYDGNGGDYSNLETTNIYVLMCSHEGVVDISGGVRIRFMDA